MPVPSVPTLQPKSPIMPKNIVIAKHDDINVKFPKMGIWVVASLGDVDVGTIDGVNIISTIGKPYPILTVKEKWDYNFNPPYVFTGPFGTVDSAVDWAKSNPNQAIVEKNKQSKVMPSVAAAQAKAQAQAQAVSDKTAAQVQTEVLNNLKEKIPAIKAEQAKTLNKIDSLISSAKDHKKKSAFILLKKSFSAEVDAMDSNITALTSAINAYVVVNPNAPIKDLMNGKTLPQIIEQCAECNAGAQEFISNLIKMG